MTVNTNFNEIQKLPSMLDCRHFTQGNFIEIVCTEYATFGRFSQAATDAAVADLVDVSGSSTRTAPELASIVSPAHVLLGPG